MSRSDTRAENRARANAEEERRAKDYAAALEEHPATYILRALQHHTPENNPLREAVEWLLERARDEDTGSP
jgi:hypothetical protein